MGASETIPIFSSTPPPKDLADFEDGRRIQQACVTKNICSAVVILAGIIQAVIGAYYFDPDGMCYLDLGRAFSNHHWLEAFNSYWSPLYAWILGVALHAFRVSASMELPIVHAVNAIIYIFDFWCFNYFLRNGFEFLRSREPGAKDFAPLPELPLWIAGNGIFLWAILTQITTWDVSPDLLVAGMVFLIAATILKIGREGSFGASAQLGILLGISYWCKAVMFPLSILFLGIAFLTAPRQRGQLRKLAVASLLFAVVSAPLVIALSKKTGHFTFGDSGWLNYSSYVSPGGRVRNWQGEPVASGIPAHATRRLFQNPDVFEFAGPIGGTYPPSYDPPYWNAGRRWTFNLHAQTEVIKQHLLLYANLFLFSQTGILAGILALLFCGGFNRNLIRGWPLLAICCCAFGLYALVHAESRFFGAYITLAWMALLLAMQLPQQIAKSKVVHYLLIAVAISCYVTTAGETFRMARDSESYSAYAHLEVARDLKTIGIGEGGQIAVIGNGNWDYYAHFDSAKIVAEIMDQDTTAFWTAPPETRNKIYAALEKTSATAIVAKPPTPWVTLGPQWIEIGHTPYFVRWLHRPQAQ